MCLNFYDATATRLRQEKSRRRFAGSVCGSSNAAVRLKGRPPCGQPLNAYTQEDKISVLTGAGDIKFALMAAQRKCKTLALRQWRFIGPLNFILILLVKTAFEAVAFWQATVRRGPDLNCSRMVPTSWNSSLARNGVIRCGPFVSSHSSNRRPARQRDNACPGTPRPPSELIWWLSKLGKCWKQRLPFWWFLRSALARDMASAKQCPVSAAATTPIANCSRTARHHIRCANEHEPAHAFRSGGGSVGNFCSQLSFVLFFLDQRGGFVCPLLLKPFLFL